MSIKTCDCAKLLGCPPRLKLPKTKYYTRDEVVIHNQPNDIWIIVHRRVLDLTQFFQNLCKLPDKPLRELLAYGGKDLSHYFHEDGNPKTMIYMDGSEKYILGAAVELSTLPNIEKKKLYWWNDPQFEIGYATVTERRLRIINTLTKNAVYLTVCEEDTINDIKTKYAAKYNHHAGSYVWRKKSRDGNNTGRLAIDKTLTENGMFKEKIENGLPPAIWLFYNDDFTIA